MVVHGAAPKPPPDPLEDEPPELELDDEPEEEEELDEEPEELPEEEPLDPPEYPWPPPGRASRAGAAAHTSTAAMARRRASSRGITLGIVLLRL